MTTLKNTQKQINDILKIFRSGDHYPCLKIQTMKILRKTLPADYKKVDFRYLQTI